MLSPERNTDFKFSESVRLSLNPNWLADPRLELLNIDRTFFAGGTEHEAPRRLTFALEDAGARTFQHEVRSREEVASWTVRHAELTRFVGETGLRAGDELLIQRASPEEFRISPLWRKFRFIDLFAGIGGIRLALEAVGGRCVFSSEIDSLACDTYEANFGERPAGDITKIPADDVPPHDILAGGFPCQAFSIIGKREGFDDTRGTLFFEIERILEARRPSAVLLENVKQFRTHDQGRTCQTVLSALRRLGYHPHVGVLNALDYGVAQKRERTFIAAFQEDVPFAFPQEFDWRPPLEAALEPESAVAPKLIASADIQRKRLERLAEQGREPFYPSMWHENKGGHIGMHPFSCALRHNASYNYLLVNGRRRPTGREMLRFQGFPESFRIVVNHTAIRAQCGNSVAVPVVRAVAARMMLALRQAEPTSPGRLF